jgi:hypothetical protein
MKIHCFGYRGGNERGTDQSRNIFRIAHKKISRTSARLQPSSMRTEPFSI